ncbi:MAG TPA: FmdB family zinc ribbon protein [Micromonosporaceae bacterium]
MPTYQYACTACGHQLEAVQSFADDPLTECPACEGRLRKLFGSVGIVFKGSGFYRTDSRSTGSGSPTGEGKGEAKPKTSAEKAPAGSSTSGGATATAGSSDSSGGSTTTKAA